MPYSAPNGINPIQYQPSDFTQQMPSSARWQTQFQEYMSNTAHQREMYDLQQAGLNPVLTVNGGSGASTPSGAVAQPSAKKVSGGSKKKVFEDLTTTGAFTGALKAITETTKKALDIVDKSTEQPSQKTYESHSGLADESGIFNPSSSRSDDGLFVSDGLLWARDSGKVRLANAQETAAYYDNWIDNSWNSNLWSNTAIGKVLSGLRLSGRAGSKGVGLNASITPFKDRGHTGKFGRRLQAAGMWLTDSDYRKEYNEMNRIVGATDSMRDMYEAGYYIDSNGKITSARQADRAHRRGRSWSASDYKIHD